MVNIQSSRFERLHELNKRIDLTKFTSLQEEFLNEQKGTQGEEDFEKFLFENGSPDWVILKNVWLDCRGVFECNYLVFTKAREYLFEIKNYTGSYVYRKSQWFRSGKPMSHNPLSQVQKAKTKLQAIFPKIKGVLVFIGEFNPVEMHEKVPSIQIVERNELMALVWEMKREEQRHRGYGLNKEAILNKLAPYEISNPYQNKPILKEALNAIKPGICCSGCANFDLVKEGGFYICGCGVYEPKEHAILRTICEYGLLYPNEHFKTASLHKFFDGELSKRTLLRILNKYFNRVGNNRNTEYVNQHIRPNNVREAFNLDGHVFIKQF